MHRLKQLCLIAVLTFQSIVAFAYGARGHEVVGAIADQLLTPTASQQVSVILGMPLQVAATWPDCVKDVNGTPAASPTSFKYTPIATYHEACKAFETPDGIARMEDYVRRNWANCTRNPTDEVCHKQYHYSDVAIEHDHYDRIYKGTSDHDIVREALNNHSSARGA